ncbi:hypothetical protein AAG906_022685 [Vitis piasezkii]
MCGGDDHLAWKCPISSEACRGLRTSRGSIDTFVLGSASGIKMRGRLIRVLDHQTEVAPLLSMVVVPTSEDAHARMDRLE